MKALADIERAAGAVLKADLHAAAERAKLQEMIVRAWEDGCTGADIARAAGVSRQRVGQIVGRAMEGVA